MMKVEGFMWARALLVLVCVVTVWTLAACSAPRIDATTDETMKTSIQEVRASLDEPKKGEFDDALKVLAFAGLDFQTLLAQGKNRDADVVGSKLRDAVDGKTADEIIAAAAEVKAERSVRDKERAQERRKQALGEIEELENKVAEAEKARVQMKAFEIKRSRFYRKKQGFMVRPYIELTVKNNTKHAIARAYFKGTLASPDRSVPWLVEEFNYSISGGLEPGEETTWTLSPNAFSKWGSVEPAEDAVLTVEVERLDGADSKALFDAEGLGEYEKNRLKRLKKEVVE